MIFFTDENLRVIGRKFVATTERPCRELIVKNIRITHDKDRTPVERTASERPTALQICLDDFKTQVLNMEPEIEEIGEMWIIGIPKLNIIQLKYLRPFLRMDYFV